MEIVRICLKFLISIYSFLVINIVSNNSYLLYYCNLRFSYRIRKVIKNIPINILGHDGKNLRERFDVCTDGRTLGIDNFCKVFYRYCGHPKVL